VAQWAADIAAGGVAWVRGFDGRVDFAGLDPSTAAGMQVSGIYGYRDPADVPAWKTYVTQTTTTFRGRVKLWEVWNEPPNFTPNTPPEDYGKMVAAAYDAAKAVDSSTQIGLAVQSVNLNYLDKALLAGASNKFDFVTVHPYETADFVAKGYEAQYMSIVPTIRKMLAARSPAQVNVPVIVTEVGQPVDATHTPSMQADQLVKLYTLGMAQGLTRTHWFEPLDGDSGPFGLLGPNNSKRPSYLALSSLASHVGQRPRYYGWMLLNGKHYSFLFAGPQGMVLVAWAQPGVTETVNLGATMKVVDPKTGAAQQLSSLQLTNSPVLIVPSADVAAWATTARANAAKPFPWGGDYSAATSVSITSPAIEKGLHAAVPTLRTIDGESVRDVSGGSGVSFTVDPNFLSYTARPIRITAVVRRNGAAGAGFNLKYEATSGVRGIGWNSVPSSTQWTTLSWLVTDPQFVGKWGTHFSFDSDSTQHSGYSIKSVTVTKE
jgi:hypothetical protein